MNTKFLKLFFLALVVFTASCSNDDKETAVVTVSATAKNIPAPQTGGQGQAIGGPFTKFSFSENKVVTTDKWDIAFRGTFIIVNGGTKISTTDTGEPERTGQAAVSIVSNTFASITAIPEATTFKQDATGDYAFPTTGDNRWFDYNSTTHLISAKAGKVYVVKTHDGKYAKFEIISYYKDAPVTPDPLKTEDTRFYTFNFAYQANANATTF